jgi:hypothetical protein
MMNEATKMNIKRLVMIMYPPHDRTGFIENNSPD